MVERRARHGHVHGRQGRDKKRFFPSRLLAE